MKRNSVAAVVCCAVAAVLPAAQTAQAAQPTLVEQRILTQEGLAIALASTVLQSQLEILIKALEGTKGCSVLTGGADSARLISLDDVSKNVTKAEVEVYFDKKCTQPYVTAHAKIVADKATSSYAVAETADYMGPTGTALGSMSLNESASFATTGGTTSVTGVSGLGQFAPASGAVSVDLGLECAFSAATANPPPPFPCSGGIAQDFPELSEALASVTPLTLTLKKSGAGDKVSFVGDRSDMVKGALGALSITAPTDSSLGIGGTYDHYGSAATKGSAAKFALFPPAPTSWSITDKANDTAFSIAVAPTRNSTGTVTEISTGTVLASFAVDQSGTGSITYSDTSTAAITSWLLAD
jgi:hypothetical protein